MADEAGSARVIAAVERLVAGLRESIADPAPRNTAMKSLIDIIEFIEVVEGNYGAHNLSAPFFNLYLALQDLKDGTVSNLLKAATVQSRPQKSTTFKFAQAHVIYCVDLLVFAGMNVESASKLVAKRLAKVGFIMPGKQRTELWMTVKNLRDGISKLPKRDQLVELTMGLRMEFPAFHGTKKKAQDQVDHIIQHMIATYPK